MPELWTQGESQVQMEVAVESGPKFPQRGLLRNKAGRVGMSNSHRCREAQGRGWGTRGGPFSTRRDVSSHPSLLKGGHCFLDPVVELISSRRPHHWRAADRPAVSSVIKETLPNEPCPGTRNMGLWPHCLGHGAGSEEDNSGLRPTLRVVSKPTVGISEVLVMIWVLTPLRGQIRLKAMAPLSSFLHWNPQTHVCALLCVDAVFPLLEC